MDIAANRKEVPIILYLSRNDPEGVHAMHSVFYATGHLTRVRVQSVQSMDKPIETKPSAVEYQAKICSAILLLALTTSCALWLVGSYV
jgi:hypothetical protein